MSSSFWLVLGVAIGALGYPFLVWLWDGPDDPDDARG